MKQKQDRILKHILIAGQSLSIGFSSGSTNLTTFQPYRNQMFFGGVVDLDGDGQTLPLVSTKDNVETIAPSMANMLTELTGDSFLVSAHGQSGAPYQTIGKRGSSSGAVYQNGMTQIRRAREIAAGTGRYLSTPIVCLIHGEADDTFANSYYVEDIKTMYDDYNGDQPSRGTEPLTMFFCQMSSWTEVTKTAEPTTPIAQLKAHEKYAPRINLVCPKYHLTYSDGIHLNVAGQKMLGEYYAHVIFHVLYKKQSWSPLRPLTINSVGDNDTGIYTTTATFHVPDKGNLVLDTTLVSNPGNFGFELVNKNKVALTITNVSVSGQTVTITSSGGIPARLRYAYTGIPDNSAGATTGPRGNLRSDTRCLSRQGNTNLFHWCVHFDKVVTNTTPAPLITTPSTTNLLAWWDATQGITPNTAITPNRASNWATRQQSGGTAFNLVQASQGSQLEITPNGLNGLQTLRCSGSNRSMICDFGSSIAFTGCDVFMVFRYLPTAGTNAAALSFNLIGNDSSTANGFIPAKLTGVFSTQTAPLFDWKTSTGVTYSRIIRGNWYIYNVRASTSGSSVLRELWLNGFYSGRNTASSQTATISVDRMVLNAQVISGAVTNQSLIEIAALLVYTQRLAQTDWIQTYNYLFDTYQIAEEIS
jgi:hypothetical protein